MRMFLRFLGRGLFALAVGALLWGMIRYPAAGGVSLHEAIDLPLTKSTTPSAVPLSAETPAEEHVRVEMPTWEERDPPVEGDIVALMYHDFTTDPAKTTAWTTTPEKFRKDLTDLLAAGYLPLSVEDYIAGRTVRGQDYFITTFDDGYTSNLTLALPVLRELSVPATVFVITGSTDLSGHMTWDELREIRASGLVTVYSHTDTHMRASSTTLAAFLADEHTAWEKLTEHLSPEKKVLAYPEGAYTKASMEALAKEGYELFVIQEKPWWYTEDNATGIRILVRHNVEDNANMTDIVARNRARAGLPTLARAAALRAERAAEDAAERARQYEAWLAYAAAKENAGEG